MKTAYNSTWRYSGLLKNYAERKFHDIFEKSAAEVK